MGKERIEQLAANLHDARLRFEAIGMMNAYGLLAEEARQQTIAYEVARAELYAAQSALEDAQRAKDSQTS